jgi:hypothetical protein
VFGGRKRGDRGDQTITATFAGYFGSDPDDFRLGF